MKNINFIKKSGLYLIGNMASKLLSAVALPVYAFFISAGELGYYDYSQTIMNIIIPIAFMAIWEAILKFILAETDSINRNKIICTSAFYSLTIILILCLSLFLYSCFSSISYFTYITTMMASHSIAQIWQYYARALSYNKVYVISSAVASVINFAAIILLVCIMDMGIRGLYLAYILGQIAIILIVEYKAKIILHLSPVNIDLHCLKKMIKFSAPLVLNLISAWLLDGLARVIITNWLGAEVNGLYSFAGKFSALITMLGTVITMALIEEAITSYKDKGFAADFSSIINTLFKLFQSLMIIAMPAISIFYRIIYKTDYFASFNYIPWLLIFSVLMTMASNIGAVFHANGQTKYQMLTTTLGGIITAAISFGLVNQLGVYSVLLGQISGAAVMLILRCFWASKKEHVYISWIRIIIGFAFIGLLSLFCLRSGIAVNSVLFVLVLLIITLLNRRDIKKCLSLVKAKLSK